MVDHHGVHMTHCFQGEYEESCKYGEDETCPARKAATLPEDYLSSLKTDAWYVILARGNFGFRYGPYTREQVAEIAQQCQDEGVPFMLSASCGTVFDWDLARDFARGVVADWMPMTHPEIERYKFEGGRPIMADVNELETRVIWWAKWEQWRVLKENGHDVGEPVTPRRWRHLTDDESRAQ